jgi:Skp family chaperone for outer membrane proteins
MGFEIYVAEELNTVARKLSEAARADTEAAIALVSATLLGQAAATRANLEAEADAMAARLQADASAGAAKLSEAFDATVERLRDDQAQLGAENERLAAENAALSWERRGLLESARASHRGALIERLLEVFDQIAAAATVDAVIIAAAGGLTGDFARVAVFSVRDNRLAVHHQWGFGADSGIEKVIVPLGVESFLSEAAQAGTVQSFSGGAGTGSAPFGGAPTLVVTAPIVVRGETLAVLYADDSGDPRDAAWSGDGVRLAGLLRAHVVLRLERLTVELQAIDELRAYAHMLLDEVQYVYDADTSANKSEPERMERLRDNVRCARQIYRQRATLDGPAATALLDDGVTRILQQSAGTPFGRDLASALRGAAVRETRAFTHQEAMAG